MFDGKAFAFGVFFKYPHGFSLSVTSSSTPKVDVAGTYGNEKVQATLAAPASDLSNPEAINSSTPMLINGTIGDLKVSGQVQEPTKHGTHNTATGHVHHLELIAPDYQPPRCTLSAMLLAGRATDVEGGSGSAASPSNTAPIHRYRSGTPSEVRSASSPRKLPRNAAPMPASVAPRRRVMVEKPASTNQNGTTHSTSWPSERTLSGSP